MQKPPPSVADILGSFDRGEVKPYELTIDPVTRNVTSLKTDGTPADYAAAQAMMKTVLEQSAVPVAPPKPKTISLIAARMSYALTESKSLKPNTWGQRERAIESFMEALGGNMPVGDITRVMASSWAHGLMARGMTKRTAANYVSHVAQVFVHLKKSGQITGENPVKGVIVVSKKEKKLLRDLGHQWEPFELDDLKRIFDPANLIRTTTEHVRWGALIGLYTGARVGEVAQLFLRDFMMEGDVPCVCFRSDSDGQSQKTESSERKVPLHPDLIKLGLWKRVERLRKAKEDRLFPEMRIDSKAGAGNSISKGMGYYLGTQLKIKPRRKNGIVGFHSLRKNVVQEIQGSGLSAERRRAYVGHEHGDLDVHADHYMRPWTAGELASLFPGLRWGEWLDFDGLKVLLDNHEGTP